MTKKVYPEHEYENFRMHQILQYDRIDKLESKRENYSNFVITLSAGIYLIGFDDLEKLNVITGNYLPIIVILANITAIVFSYKSRYWIKLHQKRARDGRKKYAPELNEINRIAELEYQEELEKNWLPRLNKKKFNSNNKSDTLLESKKDSNKDWFRRERIYQLLHLFVAIIAGFSIKAFNVYGKNCSKDISTNEKPNQELIIISNSNDSSNSIIEFPLKIDNDSLGRDKMHE